MNQRDAHEQLADLVAGYRNYFRVPMEELELLEDQIDQREDLWSRKNFRGHLTASGFVFSEDDQHVLLIHHRRLDRWLQPGGHVDPGESLVDCAIREIREETGLTGLKLHPFHQTGGFPCDINTHFIPANERKNEPNHFHHDFRYLFIVEGDTKLSQDYEEIIDAEWVKWSTVSEDVVDLSVRERIEKVKNEISPE